MNDPLDPDLAALFRKADRPAPPPGAAERVAARLEATLAIPSVPSAPAPARAGALGAKAWGLAAATFVAGAVVGGVVTAARLGTPPEVLPAPATVVHAAPSASATPSPDADAAAPDVVQRELPAPRPATGAARTDQGRGVPGADTLVEERRLLDAARSDLARGDAARALDVLDEHARRFPHGVLMEEREALAVQSLVNADRPDDARRRGEIFRSRFPHSVYRAAVDATLESIP